MGDSKVRQIWEALVCGWQDDITNITLQLNGKARLDHSKIMGTLLETALEYARSHGCHTASPYRPFYDPNTTVPTTLEHCDDDIAMVERV